MEGSSSATFTDASITYNVATNGAGIYASGSVALSFLDSTLGYNTYQKTIDGTTMYGQTRYLAYYSNGYHYYTSYSYAGGLWASSGSTLDMDGSTVIGNVGYSGYGGLYLVGTTASFSDTKFYGNTASSNGGGIYASSSTLTISNTIFNGNRASSYGGGIYATSSTLKIWMCTFVSNSGSSGGGLFTSAGTTNLNRTTFSSNSATYGSGYYMNGGTTAMASHVFSSNSGTLGYRDMHRASGTLTIEMGCPINKYNFGRDLLDCYDCSSIYYPKDLSFDECEAWSALEYVGTQDELESAIMFDRTVELTADVSLNHAVAILGFESLTGVVIDGANYTVIGCCTTLLLAYP